MAVQLKVLIVTLTSALMMMTMVSTSPSPTTRANLTTATPAGLMAAAQPTISLLQFQVKELLLKNAKNSLEKMLVKYPFMDNTLLRSPLNRLGLIVLTSAIRDCSKLSTVDKLGVLHAQFCTFMDPLNLTYTYEMNQGAQNDDLAQSLKDTQTYLENTVFYIRKSPYFPKGVQIPAGKQITESELDRRTKEILTLLQSFTKVAPTDANVQIYRNYVIVNTLEFVTRYELLPCIP